MGDKPSFSDFFKAAVASRNLTWFVTLGYVETNHRMVRLWNEIWDYPEGECSPATADECLAKWLVEVGGDSVVVEEHRAHGAIAYHILIGDWGGSKNEWEQRWKKISGGWTRTRELDERSTGLVAHLVMRAKCVLRINFGQSQGEYSAEDFRPWPAKN